MKSMKFIMIVKASKDSEAGVMPSEELLMAMGKYNEEMVKAGVLLSGEGLQASSKGAKVKFSGNQRSVMQGPFGEMRELIAGFWMIEVGSKQEAIDWALRSPSPHPGEDCEIEIRQVFGPEDFQSEAEHEQMLRDEIAKRRKI